ncbi:MAG: hypothetical protein HOP32_16080 [Nitrospira sp.]|nr:hypothetical protein [Nitrospira sp.]
MIHEHFFCHREFAAATSLDAVTRPPGRRARRSVGQYTVLSKPPSLITAPRACLAYLEYERNPLKSNPVSISARPLSND